MVETDSAAMDVMVCVLFGGRDVCFLVLGGGVIEQLGDDRRCHSLPLFFGLFLCAVSLCALSSALDETERRGESTRDDA